MASGCRGRVQTQHIMSSGASNTRATQTANSVSKAIAQYSELVQDMFSKSRWAAREGLALSVYVKIPKLTNGEVQYVREAERCYFASCP